MLRGGTSHFIRKNVKRIDHTRESRTSLDIGFEQLKTVVSDTPECTAQFILRDEINVGDRYATSVRIDALPPDPSRSEVKPIDKDKLEMEIDDLIDESNRRQSQFSAFSEMQRLKKLNKTSQNTSPDEGLFTMKVSHRKKAIGKVKRNK